MLECCPDVFMLLLVHTGGHFAMLGRNVPVPQFSPTGLLSSSGEWRTRARRSFAIVGDPVLLIGSNLKKQEFLTK